MDESLSDSQRDHFAKMEDFEKQWRQVRSIMSPALAKARASFSAHVTMAAKAAVTVYDCASTTNLPGALIPKPGTSTDSTAKAVFDETSAAADFFLQEFQRNSIDGLGMTMQSSVHFGTGYGNAFWTGSQMAYGDGDGNIFIDFSKGIDVIAHELTHGLTQHSLALSYNGEAGGLNESLSDVFGSMFRQWRKGEDVTQADWLLGKEIIGPGAAGRGITCLRDMANPDGAHCLAPQISHFSQYRPGMDPHHSSGIPNTAFYRAAIAIGGNSWTTAGKVWYESVVQFGARPNLRMKAFANKTRTISQSLFPTNAAVFQAIDSAWTSVGL